MDRRRGRLESFPRYENYLTQSYCWPSETSASAIRIREMPLSHAAFAHAKLLRWAGTMQAAVALNISELPVRQDYVRTSVLARALQAASTGKSLDGTEQERNNRLLGLNDGSLTEVTPRAMILVFAPIVAEHTSLDIQQVFTLCEKLATRADELWTITVPPG